MGPRTLIWAGAACLTWAAWLSAAPSAAAPPPPELEKARENLKLSEQTRDRIAAELADIKASGKASPEVVAAYEVYLARVQDIVVEHQRAVAQMEAAVSAHSGGTGSAGVGSTAKDPPPTGSAPGAGDRLHELDRQFNESLAAFDEMLLKELRLIQAASARRLQGLTAAAAKAGRQAGAKGPEGAAGEKGGAEGSAAAGAEGAEKEPGSAGAERAGAVKESGQTGATSGGGPSAGSWGPGGSGAAPGSYAPSPDDDIVARQLREAAEKETDPELKARLWKEYEDYKKSRSKP